MPKLLKFSEIVGSHPQPPHPLGVHFATADGHSKHGVPYRALADSASPKGNEFVKAMREWLITHHARPEELERDRKRREALARQGFAVRTKRFPSNPNTRKGNWGEVLLAEYLSCTCNAQIPVYRLRYNPNIEQAMKGDDVLAFDLDSDPVRIVVGEAKFRETPTKKAVVDIIEVLEKSHSAGVPISLQFVADRLFQEGQEELGQKVEECSDLFVRGNLRLDHVGLLVSNQNASVHVARHAISSVRRLALISLGLSDPAGTVESSYRDLESVL